MTDSINEGVPGGVLNRDEAVPGDASPGELATDLEPRAEWSTIRRRNSRLEVLKRDGVLEVCKTYLDEYTAEQEDRAYRELEPICAGVRGIRLPIRYGVNAAANSIRLEYVSGQDLRAAIAADGFEVLREHEQALVSLFTAAQASGVRFDSDPSNFIRCEATGELVLIDPVCKLVDLRDFVVVVFLFGLVKAALASPFRVGLRGLPHVLRSFREAYCDQSVGVDRGSIRHQLAEYLGVVIRWNQQSSEVESIGLKLVRRCGWIPVLRVVRWWLRRGEF